MLDFALTHRGSASEVVLTHRSCGYFVEFTLQSPHPSLLPLRYIRSGTSIDLRSLSLMVRAVLRCSSSLNSPQVVEHPSCLRKLPSLRFGAHNCRYTQFATARYGGFAFAFAQVRSAHPHNKDSYRQERCASVAIANNTTSRYDICGT